MNDKRQRRSGSFVGLLVGLLVVGVGVVWLLIQMGLLVRADVWLYWPSLLIAVGVVKLIGRGQTSDRAFGGLMILAGAAFQLHTLGWIHLQWRLVWPVLIILGGLWIAWFSIFHRKSRPESLLASGLADVVVFGGRQSRVSDKDYRGSEGTAVFGGYEIDFTDADIEGDEAVFEARAIFGGVEIRVPDHWLVVVKGAPIMGSFEDKTRPPRREPGLEPKRLIISGFAIFGGVEIKNYMSADFTNRARLGFFLAWLPLTGLLVVLLAVRGGIGWLESIWFALPLCGVYSLLCRSSWYIAKATPVRTSGLVRLVVTNGVSSLVASGLWQLVALGFAQVFGAATRDPLMARLPLLFGVGVTYYLLAVIYHYLVLSMEESRQAEQREAQANTLAREAELKALRAQLNPHFLFNSLNSIAALTAVDPDRARDMTVTLSDFLRGSLRVGDRPLIPLSEELELSRHYLGIERIRFADRMEVTEEIAADCLDCQLPPLLLQPLVENAVKHGVAGQLEGGWVRLTARRDGDRLHVIVENAFQSDGPAPTGGGHGLAIVRQRLSAHYRDDASLRTRVVESDPVMHRAELRLPCIPTGD